MTSVEIANKEVTSSTDNARALPALCCHAKRENLLRLHPIQPAPRALHRDNQQYRARIFQHKAHTFAGFTAKYNITNLVYFERYGDVLTAIRREKELKDWRREKKIKLIESTNSTWRDLSYGWYQRHQFQPERKIS
jgi:predicted GIY-YIG superfamily endonuclease